MNIMRKYCASLRKNNITKHVNNYEIVDLGESVRRRCGVLQSHDLVLRDSMTKKDVSSVEWLSGGWLATPSQLLGAHTIQT